MMASQAPDWPYRAAYPLVRVSHMKLMTSQPALATKALLGCAWRITCKWDDDEEEWGVGRRHIHQEGTG